MLTLINLTMKNILNKILTKRFQESIKPFRQTDVCIIGGGSVGLAFSSLLSKFKVDHLVIEKEEKIPDHPKAHYLSPRTIEIMNYFDTFRYNEGKSILENNLNNLNYWRHYRYCGYLLDSDSYYGEIDHFQPDPKAKLEYINEISNAYPMHIGQNKLNKLLYNNNKGGDRNENFIKGQNFESFNYNKNEDIYEIYSKDNNNTNLLAKSKFIVACDGSHSRVRKLLNIKSKGDKNIQSFVNAHFFSLDLAKRLKEINKQSMLHFIFNPQFVCVLISYDIEKGEFVIQIPYSTEIEKESSFDENECRKIIDVLISDDKETRKSIRIVKIIFNIWILQE